MQKINQLMHFLSTDIWRIRTRQLPKSRSFWINQLRIFLLAFQGFNEDRCQLRASALTFYTLLSVVPVLAMAFGFARGFGFDTVLQNQIVQNLPGQEEVARKMIAFANAFLENTKNGVIAGVGVVLLFWTVVQVLNNIEQSFNEIWGIQKGRTLARQFSDYLAMVLICPVLLITAGSLTVMVTNKIDFLAEKFVFLGPVGSALLYLFHFLPYIVVWLLFVFIYVFMPNTTVSWRSGIIGGIIAGTAYQIAQWGYITFQIGVSRYGAIYGSFAALPLFLTWLQVSWLIVLFGAEISFAEQNVETYEFEPDSLHVSNNFKRLVALCVAHVCIKKFAHGQTPVTSLEIAHELGIPLRLVNLVIYELTEAGVLSETKFEDGKSPAFQPAMDISVMTVQWVLQRLDQRGTDEVPLADTDEVKKIRASLAAISAAVGQAPANVALKDI
jgi:membrane protein